MEKLYKELHDQLEEIKRSTDDPLKQQQIHRAQVIIKLAENITDSIKKGELDNIEEAVKLAVWDLKKENDNSGFQEGGIIGHSINEDGLNNGEWIVFKSQKNI